MLKVEGGNDMKDLFKHVGKVLVGDTYDAAVTKIKTALKRRGNRTSAVFKLFNGHPQGSQSFDTWHREVYKAATLVDWTAYDGEKAAVDAIVMQTSSTKLQQRAIQENPNYEDLVHLGISQEQAKKKATKLPDGDNEVVNRLKLENQKLKGQMKNKQGKQIVKCEKCCHPKCRDPSGPKCWATSKVCTVCKGTGHYAASKLCPKKTTTKTTSKRINEATESGSDSEESVGRIMMDTVSKVQDEKKSSIFTTLGVTGPEEEDTFEAKIRMATDTGVRKTILNRSDWKKVQDKAMMVKTKIKFRPYGTDTHLPVRGRAKVQLRAKAGAVITTYVYVNDDDKESSLLGKRDAQRLGIIKINLEGREEEVKPEGQDRSASCRRIKQNKKTELVKLKKPSKESQENVKKKMDQVGQDFKDIFGGIGKYKGDPIKIQMADNINPVIQSPRKIPLHYRQPLKDHLAEMVEEDVIEGPLAEEEEGSWISNLVITDKKWDAGQKLRGERVQIRANLDCRPINEHVYQTHEPIPTPDELRHQLKGSNKFSTLDLAHSFHQFVLEDKAKKLFTFRTPWGLYRYKRLVMGNSPASSEAHRRIKTVVQGCEGIAQIKDDILVYGTGEEHDIRLRAVLERFRDAGLTLRKEKCYLGVPEVKWFGMIYSEEGMTADPEKTAVIKNWPSPKTVKDVKSFLQTVQFNAVYMAAEEPEEMNYPELTAPLRLLTRRKTKFTWTAQHEEHFQKIKDRLCSDRVMVPYDPARSTRLYSDGGPEGCQATVAQRYEHPEAGEQWRPVAHTARAWTDTEKRYSQIEKESNALYSGIISNKTYLLGTEFMAFVDHRPLLPLYNTPRRPKQMRVDRHRMKLAAYDFKVDHVSGTNNPCDYGSRKGCPKPMKYTAEQKERAGVEDDDEIYVNRLVDEQLPVAITKDMLRESTSKDTKLQMLMEDIQIGQCRKALTRYTQVFEELSVVEGLVVRGQQLVIPGELQPLVVQIAHEGHLGSDKTLGLLRETCWFPGMGEMVRQYVESCLPCLAAVPGTQQEPLKPTLLPERPWQHLHADFKGPIGKKYYLHTIIDQYSKYPVVDVCTSTSWEAMEPMLDNALSMFGHVETLTTDNGPPYSSNEFKKYSKRNGFHHRLCTPENPAANGFAEVFQKVLVKLVHTAVIEKKDPRKEVQTYLRSYRAAPHKTTGKSPFELLFNRKMTTKLPQLPKKPEPKLDAEVRQKHDEKKAKQKVANDNRKKAKEKDIKVGDKILIQRKKSSLKSPWDPEPFEVVEVKGSKVKGSRGSEVKERAKNRIKQVKERPEHLKIKTTRKKYVPEEDLEVSMETIRNMRSQPENVLPDLPVSSGEEEDEPEGGHQQPPQPPRPPPRPPGPPGGGAPHRPRSGTFPRQSRVDWAQIAKAQRENRAASARRSNRLMKKKAEKEVTPVPRAEVCWGMDISLSSPEPTARVCGVLRVPELGPRLQVSQPGLCLATLEMINPTWGGEDEPDNQEQKTCDSASPRKKRRQGAEARAAAKQKL